MLGNKTKYSAPNTAEESQSTWNNKKTCILGKEEMLVHVETITQTCLNKKYRILLKC